MGLGARNHFFSGQQGNVPFPSIGASQVFSPFSNASNPYQGVFSSFKTYIGGNIHVYGNPTMGGGPSPNYSGLQGFSYGSEFSTKNL